MISNEAFEILKTLNTCGKVDVSPENRDSLMQLRNNGFIAYRMSSSEDSSGHRRMCWKDIRITEDGKAYLQSVESEKQSVREQISVLREMADTSKQRLALHEEELSSQKKGLSAQQQELIIAKRNLALYKQQLEDARKDTAEAAIRSWIAICISVISIAVSIAISVLSSGWIK